MSSVCEHDEELKCLTLRVSKICLSAEFIKLRGELEELYRENAFECPELDAFADALYAIISQGNFYSHNSEKKFVGDSCDESNHYGACKKEVERG
jgi:hypothetical protein